MKPEVDNHIEVPAKLWIPVVGYYLNYYALPVGQRVKKWLRINTGILVAAVILTFTVSFKPVIPVGLSASYLFVILVILLIIAISAAMVESTIVLHSKDPSNRTFRSLGWTQLAGHSLKYIFVTFLYFNYQETMFGFAGIAFIFLSHTF